MKENIDDDDRIVIRAAAKVYRWLKKCACGCFRESALAQG